MADDPYASLEGHTNAFLSGIERDMRDAKAPADYDRERHRDYDRGECLFRLCFQVSGAHWWQEQRIDEFPCFVSFALPCLALLRLFCDLHSSSFLARARHWIMPVHAAQRAARGAGAVGELSCTLQIYLAITPICRMAVTLIIQAPLEKLSLPLGEAALLPGCATLTILFFPGRH